MGEISETYGECCRVCKARLNEDASYCVNCFQKFLFPTNIPNTCPLCDVPNTRQKHCVDCSFLLKNKQYYLDGFAAISYTIRADFGYALHAYKGSLVPKKPYMVFPLQVLTSFYLSNHMECLEKLFGVEFDFVTHIPGTAGLIINNKFNEYEIDGDILQEVNEHLSYSAREDVRRFDETRFDLNKNCSIKNKSILLFDDVYTTGCTIQSAAYALKKHGAKNVIGLVAGRHISEKRLQNIVKEYEGMFDITKCYHCE